jgi:outer membrane protein assembly factor BamD
MTIRIRLPLSRARMATVATVALLLGIAPGCGKHEPKAPKDKYATLTAVQVYDVAMNRMHKKSYAAARETLQKVLGRSDATPDLIAKVHIALADAYFYDGGILNLAEAQSRYTNFLTFYPNHERADYAQYQLGLCYLKQTANPDRDQDETRKALAELTKVKTNYPNSEYLGPADAKADEARELLAEHEFRIGYFYFRRHSYAGAIQRFREVLNKYPNYSRKDHLYLRLGESLLGTSKDDEGRLYLQKLVAEFPKSRYVGEARSALKQPPVPAQAPQPATPPPGGGL